jgi:hypothetical protein
MFGEGVLAYQFPSLTAVLSINTDLQSFHQNMCEINFVYKFEL